MHPECSGKHLKQQTPLEVITSQTQHWQKKQKEETSELTLLVFMCSWNTPRIDSQIQCNLYDNSRCLFLNRNLQGDLKFIWTHKGIGIGKIVLKRTKLKDSHLSVSKLTTQLQ